MKSHRRIAVTVGILFIIGTVSGVLSGLITAPILDAPDYLSKVTENEHQIMLGALFVLSMGLSLAMIPVVIYPILKKQNETLALGYVVFRGALETFTYMATAISWFLLIVLSRDYIQVSALDSSHFQVLGVLLLDMDDQVNHVLKIVFPLGALIFNYLLFQSKIVPRWLSVWGILAVALHFTEGLLTLFGVLPVDAETIMAIPIFFQEMVFAVFLIVKGFNPSAMASLSAKQI
jgi:hypothetical protein